MEVRIYNTLTREIEPVKDRQVNLYTCGPTVYDVAHIGNLRSFIFADTLRRVLELNGYQVRWVMNLTDVDDKTIKRTVDEFGPQATPENLRVYTDRYIEAFRKNLADVNIPESTIEFIRVADVIPQIVTFIKELMRKEYAYKAEDGVYFNIARYQSDFGDYGALVGKDFLEGKKVGARVKVDEYEKDNLSDFALWKGRDPSDGNIFWSDPELGEGRPGWHIECSVINRTAFGENPTTIHTGGVDLIFPHHTNEIAQSQPFYRPFVKHWGHSEHLMVNGKKMAKSEGNFFTLEDLKQQVPNAGLAFRYLALQTSYRTKMNFQMENLAGAANAVNRLNGSSVLDAPYAKNKFDAALAEDLNTAQALGVIAMSPSAILLEILGLKAEVPAVEPLPAAEIPPEVAALLGQRAEARANKQFIQSDALRDQIDALGYRVTDTPDDQQVFRK